MAATIASICMTLNPSGALAVDTMGPVALQIPASKIQIGRVSRGIRTDSEFNLPQQCVAFTNESQSPVAQVTFDFSFLPPPGVREGGPPLAHHGSEEVDDVLPFYLPRHPLPTGVPIGFDSDPNLADVCAYGDAGAVIGSYPGPSRFLVFVLNVRYQSGDYWQLVPNVVGKANGPVDAPMKLANVETYIYSWSRPPLTGEYAPFQLCSDLQNLSSKTITHVQIVFQHLAGDGSDLGDDDLDVRTKIPAGAVVSDSCRASHEDMDPSVRTYAQMASNGNSLPPPTILYKSQASDLSAQISRVDFADGTSWLAP